MFFKFVQSTILFLLQYYKNNDKNVRNKIAIITPFKTDIGIQNKYEQHLLQFFQQK